MSLNRLMGFSVFGAFACTGVFVLFKHQVSKNILNNPLCKQVTQAVNENPGATHFLGKPVTSYRAEFEGSAWTSSDETKVKVMLKGSKEDGIVYFSLVEKEGQKKITSVQLQIGKDASRRLLIKNLPQDIMITES